MHRFMPVAIMARFILFMVHPGGVSSAGVEAKNLHADGALYPDSAKIIPRKKRVSYFKFV